MKAGQETGEMEKQCMTDCQDNLTGEEDPELRPTQLGPPRLLTQRKQKQDLSRREDSIRTLHTDSLIKAKSLP